MLSFSIYALMWDAINLISIFLKAFKWNQVKKNLNFKNKKIINKKYIYFNLIQYMNFHLYTNIIWLT